MNRRLGRRAAFATALLGFLALEAGAAPTPRRLSDAIQPDAIDQAAPPRAAGSYLVRITLGDPPFTVQLLATLTGSGELIVSDAFNLGVGFSTTGDRVTTCPDNLAFQSTGHGGWEMRELRGLGFSFGAHRRRPEGHGFMLAQGEARIGRDGRLSGRIRMSFFDVFVDLDSTLGRPTCVVDGAFEAARIPVAPLRR